MFLIISAIILIILSILIIITILLQEDKAHGGIGFLGGTSQSVFGSSSGSILTRITSILLTTFLVYCVVVAIVCSHKTSDLSIKKEAIKEAEITNYIDKKIDFKSTDLSGDALKKSTTETK